MTGTTTPDPAREWAEAWLKDHPDAQPADVQRAVGVVYGKDEADRVAAIFREPLTVADIPAGQGPASLFIAPFVGSLRAVYFKAEDGRVARVTEENRMRHEMRVLWDHLAATLPHVTTEEGP